MLVKELIEKLIKLDIPDSCVKISYSVYKKVREEKDIKYFIISEDEKIVYISEEK